MDLSCELPLLVVAGGLKEDNTEEINSLKRLQKLHKDRQPRQTTWTMMTRATAARSTGPPSRLQGKPGSARHTTISTSPTRLQTRRANPWRQRHDPRHTKTRLPVNGYIRRKTMTKRHTRTAAVRAAVTTVGLMQGSLTLLRVGLAPMLGATTTIVSTNGDRCGMTTAYTTQGTCRHSGQNPGGLRRLTSSTEADWGGRSHGGPGHGVAPRLPGLPGCPLRELEGRAGTGEHHK